ncbi:MAG TPA: hypothetical protein VNA24_14275 [Hyalangium sp.]|nr:hypothetical protein [Hyalangium sp.]
MKIRSLMWSLAAVALLFTGPALAQIEAQEVDERLNLEYERPPAGLDVRFGFSSMTGDLAADTGTAPLLGIAATAQPWPLVGIELGYEGSRFPIDDVLVGEGEGLWRHNVGLLAKAGPLVAEHWRPFIGAGAGLSYINPSEGAEFLYDDDLTEEIPLAAGLEFNVGAITAGARATYRVMLGESFADEASPGESNGDIFDASVTVGGRF